MEFIFSLFSVVFIALIVGCALFFGFVILMWVMAGAVAFAVFIYLREVVRRWMFLRNATPRSSDIIEVEYTDITDNKGK